MNTYLKLMKQSMRLQRLFSALDDVQAYLEIKKIFLADAALQESISEFQDLKQSYEEVKEYAVFRPEVKEICRQLLQKKMRA